MTRFFNSKLKTKLIVLLSVLCLLFSCVGLYACQDEEEVKDPTYTVEEESSDLLIKNGSFNVGTFGVELKNLPIASPKSWTKAQTDNYSISSSVNSGVVDTKDSSWETVLKNLYADGDFVSYLKNLLSYSESDLIEGVRTEKGDDNYEPSQEELIDYAIENYVIDAYANPGKSPEAEDNYVYMLNNIGKNTNYGLGLAQKVTSSTQISMKKGNVYAVSVWVKTVNLNGQGEIGANIRLTNTFDSKSQAEYRISNITCTDWTKYTIYVKPDADYTGTFTLVLGLGYGNGSSNASDYYTEGSVYFDDIKVEAIKKDNFNEPLSADNMVLAGEEAIEATLVQKTNTHYACLYEMGLKANETGYLNDLSNIAVSSAFTTSNVLVDDGNGNMVPLTSQVKVGAESTQTLTEQNGEYKMEVNKASSTITIKNTGNTLFNVEPGKYALISFYLRNKLEEPADTNVYVDVMDVNGATEVKRAASITIAEPNSEFTRYLLVVKNNFKSGDRSFYLNLVVGPNDVSSVIYDSDFSTGSVIVKDFEIASDFIDEDEADETYADISEFLIKKATATVALYAGFNADYSEDETTGEESFATRPGNLGDIIFNPTPVKDYTGIVPNHSYINSNSNAETYVDTRTGKGNDDGVAGLINTKYLAEYDNKDEIEAKLGLTYGDDDMQVLMINNKTANHYGFVGNKINMPATKNGAVHVTLKVCDNATAYVYLVDVSGSNKEVLTFEDFTTNTDVVPGVEKGTQVKGSDLRYELKVTADMMDADGYATVSFYLGTGATAKSFRVEVWNGGRDGEDATASQGYVFVKSITSNTNSGFIESSSWNSTFSVEGNPLYENHKASFKTLYAYQRQLTELELEYNEEYPDEAISYETNYVWAKSDKVVYGTLAAIYPEAYDPFEGIEEEEEETSSGCTAESDPSTFWLSFSSIILAVLLVAAIVVLILKRVIAKRKANRSDALSHYKVTSRISANKKTAKAEESKEEEIANETLDEEEAIEETTSEEASDEYVYGEVQSFDEETTEEATEETTSEETSNETNE